MFPDTILDCYHCGKPRSYSILDEYSHDPSDGNASHYAFARCDTCELFTLFQRVGEIYEASYIRLWPPDTRHIEFTLPDLVRDSYDEAVRCEEAEAYIAAVVMIRRSLEAVCKEYNPNYKTIYSGLQDMLNNGAISQEIMDWATELRILGNKGAHATSDKVTEAETKEALDFLRAILEIFYYLRPKFKNWQDAKKKP